MVGNVGIVQPPEVARRDSNRQAQMIERERAIAAKSGRIVKVLRPGVFDLRPSLGKLGILPLGRLVQLFEAAGKVRVIAIVDPITQWVLKPIHD